MSTVFRMVWTTIVAFYMWHLIDMVEAFQGATPTTASSPRHRHAPQIGARGINTLQPHLASLFAGFMSEQKQHQRRRQRHKQISPRLWQAKSNVGDKSDKTKITLAVKIRKFIMSLFRLLMAPLVSTAPWFVVVITVAVRTTL